MLLGSGLLRLFHIPNLNAMKPSIFERMLLAAAAVALTLGLAYAAQATPTSPSRETPVTSRIDHVVVYEQGAQVERVAEVALNEGIHMLVFGGLHTGIDPSRIRLTGKGGFTVLDISHRYHTDTLGGGKRRKNGSGSKPAQPPKSRHSEIPNEEGPV